MITFVNLLFSVYEIPAWLHCHIHLMVKLMYLKALPPLNLVKKLFMIANDVCCL